MKRLNISCGHTYIFFTLFNIQCYFLASTEFTNHLFYLRLWRQHTRLVFFPSVKLYMKYKLRSSYFKVHEKVCFWNFIKKTKHYHQMDNLPLELAKKRTQNTQYFHSCIKFLFLSPLSFSTLLNYWKHHMT